MDTRAALEAEDLLKIVLVLVVVWLLLQIAELVLEFTLGLFRPIIGFLIVLAIVLWLLDRI